MIQADLFPVTRYAGGAVIDGSHRYRLWRAWPMVGASLRVCFVMLNPSTADGSHDDATIRKCMAYARRWGYAGIEVVNLYSFRTTNPKSLREAGYLNGPAADGMIRMALIEGTVGMLLYAWGAHAQPERVREVHAIARKLDYTPGVLRITKSGYPAHPLYLKGDLEPTTLTDVQNDQLERTGKLVVE
jgi:hypothetical protein